jgi:hypothetical protein
MNNRKMKKKKKNIDKNEYLKYFNASKYGPLHKQLFFQEVINSYQVQLKKIKQHLCNNCNEMWLSTNNVCIHCKNNPIKV